MLTLVGPSSSVHWTSLSSSSIPPLRDYLSTRPSSTKANLHTEPILTLLPALSPPVDPSRVCLLDPRATEVLAPEDADKFDVFLYGGILGDDPPRDRTGELRKLGFPGRHLGPVQMTTDTAVGVSKIVVEDKSESDRRDLSTASEFNSCSECFFVLRVLLRASSASLTPQSRSTRSRTP
jgi:hypothetical protein